MRIVQPYKRILVFILSLILWISLVAAWSIVWMQCYATGILRPFGYKGNWLVIAVYGILLFFFTSIYGGYRIGYYRGGDIAFSGILAMLITNGITYLQASLIGRELLDILPFALLSLVQTLIIVVWAVLSGKLYIRVFPPWEMLMVYGGDKLSQSLIEKMSTRKEKYHICEKINIDQGLDNVYEAILRYKAVIISDVLSPQRNSIIKYCYDRNIRVYMTPKLSDIIIRGANDISLFDSPLLLLRGTGLSVEQLFMKRLLDIIVSLIALIITAPFMVLIAIAIKIEDRGPIFYKQERLTKDGKIFEVLKFRSMVPDAEKKTGVILAREDDNRITTVGKIIRKTRCDELPQFINIIKGDMSVVGPRPERPGIAEEYTATIPEFSFRLKVKAGLTGYAQVIGRYNTSAYDKLKMDMMYIANYSFFKDIALILMTVKILFIKESTQGF